MTNFNLSLIIGIVWATVIGANTPLNSLSLGLFISIVGGLVIYYLINYLWKPFDK